MLANYGKRPMIKNQLPIPNYLVGSPVAASPAGPCGPAGPGGPGGPDGPAGPGGPANPGGPGGPGDPAGPTDPWAPQFWTMAVVLSLPALASTMHVVGNSIPCHVNRPFRAVGTSTALPGLIVNVTAGARG